MTIGERIREKRKKKEYTLEQLADEIGVTKSTILKYENGSIAIPSDKIEKIAKSLKTTPAYLMGWEEKLKDEKQLKDIINQIVNAMKKNQITPKELALKSEVNLDTINSLENENTDLSLLKISDIGNLMFALNIIPKDDLNEMTVKEFTSGTFSSFEKTLGAVAIATSLIPVVSLLTIGLVGLIESKAQNIEDKKTIIKADKNTNKLKNIFEQIKKMVKNCKEENKKYLFDVIQPNGDAAEFKIIDGEFYIFTFNIKDNPINIKYYKLPFAKIQDKKMLYKFLLENGKKFFNNPTISISDKEKLANELQEEFYKAKFNLKK